MGLLLLAGHHADLDALEAGLFQPLVEIRLREARPAITIQFARLLESVSNEVQQQKLTAGLQDSKGRTQRLGGVLGVVQCLAEHHDVHGVRLDRRVLEVPETELQILQSILAGLAGAELDHLLGVVDGDHLAAPPRQQFGEQSLTGTEVGYHQGRQHAEQQVSEGLPGATGSVTPIESAGDLIEVHLRLLLPTGEHAFEVHDIAIVFGQFPGPLDGEAGKLVHGRPGSAVQPVEGALALPTRREQSRVGEQAQMGGDAGLAKASDLLKLVDGELGFFQERDDAEPGRVRQGSQGFEDRRRHAGATLSGLGNGFTGFLSGRRGDPSGKIIAGRSGDAYAHPARMSAEYKMIGGDGREYGPASLEEIRLWCEEGRVFQGTPVWRSDEARWQPARDWDELKWDLPIPSLAEEPPVDSQPSLPTASQTVPAGFWIRGAAFVIDWLILASLVSILTLPWAEPLSKLQAEAFAQAKSPTPDYGIIMHFWLISVAIDLPLGFLYFTAFVGARGATPGKQLLGLRVVREDGSPVGYGRAFLRRAAQLISALTLGSGYLMVAFHPEKRALHDLLAGTRVVRIR